MTDAEHAAILHLAPEEQVTLEKLERRRTNLWIVAGIFILATSTVVAIALTDSGPGELLPDAPALRWSFLALSLAFILYVVDRERAYRRLTRALIETRVLAASLQARIGDLTTLSRVGRLVNSVLSREDVLGVILSAVFELTGAARGSVLFLEDGLLRVAVSEGSNPVPRGSTLPLGSGVAGWVAQNREPVLIRGGLGERQFPGHHASGRPRGSAVCAPLLAGDEILGVLTVERPSGAEPFTDVELRSVMLFADHAATAVVNARRYEEQRATVDRLATVLERRSEFVATLVHELKTPLTAVVGFARILQVRDDDLTGEARRQAVSSILAQAKRLVEMVDEILRAASAEAGADLSREPVDLVALIREVVVMSRAFAAGRDGCDRPFEVRAPAVSPDAWGDPEALRRVFGNLVENAVKYSPPESPVEIEIETAEDEVRVHVTDHGSGIDSEDLEQIFDRFRQTTNRVAGGVGLGLYIVRSLVQAHGGQVWAQSTPGAGSTFTVALPVRQGGAAARPGTTDDRESPAPLDDLTVDT